MICLVECRNENIQILNIEIDGSNNNYDEIEKIPLSLSLHDKSKLSDISE